MVKQHFIPAIAVVALAFLNACVNTGNVTSVSRDSSTLPALSAAQSASVVGRASVGDTVELPTGNPTGAPTADIVGEYNAASNRRCRQVLPRNGATTGNVRLACERRDGSWEWVRSLTSVMIAKPLPAVATIGAYEPLVPADAGLLEQ